MSLSTVVLGFFFVIVAVVGAILIANSGGSDK